MADFFLRALPVPVRLRGAERRRGQACPAAAGEHPEPDAGDERGAARAGAAEQKRIRRADAQGLRREKRDAGNPVRRGLSARRAGRGNGGRLAAGSAQGAGDFGA